MNIVAEKEEIIQRLKKLEDVSVIDAVKDLLDFAQTANDTEFQKELETGVKQSDNREARPHKVVWAEIRNRYKK